MEVQLRRTWDRFLSWLRGRSASKPTPVYVNRHGEKPYYQRLTCENQVRSSTGPMARHSRPRR